MDLVYLGIALLCWAATAWLVRACEALQRGR